MNDDTRREIELAMYRNVFSVMLSLWNTPRSQEQLKELARAYNPGMVVTLESTFYDYEALQKTREDWERSWERLQRLYGKKTTP